MNGPCLEAFLAKIYVDKEARSRFLNDPRGEASKAGLAEEGIRALENIDRIGLLLMAASLERKGLAESNKAKSRIRQSGKDLKRRGQDRNLE